jgi:hypothetical protein
MNYYPNNNNINNNNTFNHKSNANHVTSSLFDSYLSSLQQQQQQQQNDFYTQIALPRSRQNSTSYPIAEASFSIPHPQRVYYPQIMTAPGSTRRLSSQYNTFLPVTVSYFLGEKKFIRILFSSFVFFLFCS